MNISDVTNDIKLTLGLNTIALPYKDSTENVIGEILKVSIRTFSQFKPLIKEGFEEKKKLRSPDSNAKKNCVFYLPESLTTTPVMYADAYVASATNQDGEILTNAFTVGSPLLDLVLIIHKIF
jgi:hypothetical protein